MWGRSISCERRGANIKPFGAWTPMFSRRSTQLDTTPPSCPSPSYILCSNIAASLLLLLSLQAVYAGLGHLIPLTVHTFYPLGSNSVFCERNPVQNSNPRLGIPTSWAAWSEYSITFDTADLGPHNQSSLRERNRSLRNTSKTSLQNRFSLSAHTDAVSESHMGWIPVSSIKREVNRGAGCTTMYN